MIETKEQKTNLIIISVLIVSLIGVSLWDRKSFNYQDKNQYSQDSQEVKAAREYLAYLSTLKTDPEASKQLFQTIITQDEIKQEVENALQSNAPVPTPQVDAASIKVSSKSDKASVENYLGQSVKLVMDFNNQAGPLQENLFTGDNQTITQAKKLYAEVTANLQKLSVPKDALVLHRSLIASMAGYGKLLNSAGQYDATSYDTNDAIWPQVYQAYAVINDSTQTFTDELNNLAGKYQITQIEVPMNLADSGSPDVHIPFVKTAHAFGLANFSFTIGDVPRTVIDAIEKATQAAFLQFLGAMLSKLISKIEQNYMIANFLYYSDALVSGQYTDDYLNKYVSNAVDRQIIKKFIPQFSCGASDAALKPILQAKAKDYLGFSPQNVDPKDPDYFSKMAKVGDFLASDSGWRTYLSDLANKTQSEAQAAANKELNSPGLKTAHNIVSNGLAKSLSGIISAQRASFNALLTFGQQNAKSIITSVVSQLTQTLINNFVFKGATGGGIGVLKEQSTCVAVAQIQPISALDNTAISNSTSAPSLTQIQSEQGATQCILQWDSLGYNEKVQCRSTLGDFNDNVCSANIPTTSDPNLCQEVRQFLDSH